MSEIRMPRVSTETPTPQLRWAVPDATSTMLPRLQQLWEISVDHVVLHEWRDVPTVVVKDVAR